MLDVVGRHGCESPTCHEAEPNVAVPLARVRGELLAKLAASAQDRLNGSYALGSQQRMAVRFTRAPGQVSPPRRQLHLYGGSVANLPVSRDTALIDLFDEFAGEFLLLGQPGAGKTTLLIELLRDLVARARRNADARIPVVINCASSIERQAGRARRSPAIRFCAS